MDRTPIIICCSILNISIKVSSSILLLLLLLVPGLVPESPRWLLVQGGERAKLVTIMIEQNWKDITITTAASSIIINPGRIRGNIHQGNEVLSMAEDENGITRDLKTDDQIPTTTSQKQVREVFQRMRKNKFNQLANLHPLSFKPHFW